MKKLSKQERHILLCRKIEEIPFLTDEALAEEFDVSVPTIRLDRLTLGIPELRERMKHMAEENLNKVKSLHINEVIGDVLDLQLNSSAISILEIQKSHVLQKNKIARGHYLFAQANSLAVAVIDADVVVTASANIRFLRPVYLGEKCVAKAAVVSENSLKGSFTVKVTIFVNNEQVFEGDFKVAKYLDGK
ncbi:fatty acid biosynthesis transcriptional regulator [Desulfuribacillus stibiiarsenatis]|uniref:Fatty acid biosynthesis transcriptional regulator n=1 Tax=Desulfuribacillus stibiiarsenatis TaxID=1390249 RepID=A0A1E5L6Y8_9FIRM|nr:transcription factor FapR [Desulfuribacillus stibiiarsenatis]OEH85774.1 fatty acid biosynthesis transcriptional regulator [Desulfuribacillus stibiiarsenatis]